MTDYSTPRADTVRRLLVMVAMQAEAEPVVQQLDMTELPAFRSPLPMRAWEAGLDEGIVRVVTNGLDSRTGVDLIATQPATLATHAAIERFSPDLVISAGTAGGFAARGASVGDVYLSASPIVFHDRRIALEGFDVFGRGSFDVPALDGLAKRLNLRTGIVSTGNALDLPESDLAEMQATGAEVKEMEAAAVAWVASLHGIPMFALKAITDLVDSDGPTEQQFMGNLELAVESLTGALDGVIHTCLGRTLSALGDVHVI